MEQSVRHQSSETHSITRTEQLQATQQIPSSGLVVCRSISLLWQPRAAEWLGIGHLHTQKGAMVRASGKTTSILEEAKAKFVLFVFPYFLSN